MEKNMQEELENGFNLYRVSEIIGEIKICCLTKSFIKAQTEIATGI